MRKLARATRLAGFLVGDDPIQTANIYAKGNGIVCGMLFADETIRLIEPEAGIEYLVQDGDAVGPGTVLMRVQARASTFFIIERSGLDWLRQSQASLPENSPICRPCEAYEG